MPPKKYSVKNSSRKSVGFIVCENVPGIFESKLGGLPYFPKSMEYPKSEDGLPLRLLAQINFEKIPHIPDFPEKGILQFFILPDDLFGCDLDDLTTQKNFRVIYHKDIISDERSLLTQGELTDILGALYIIKYKYDNMPFKTDAGFTLDPVPGSPPGERFLAYTDGYPRFTQDDPRREYEELRKYDTVLFEMLSSREKNDERGEPEIMWGDDGTGAFLIPREKLIACDFSDILYNYDCC